MDPDTLRDRQIWSLVLDDACRVIVGHLQAAGQPFIMLKGATIATWLYENPAERTYVDLDILVPPTDERLVLELLGQLGYRALLDPATLRVLSPEEQPLRNRLGVVVDLHVGLKGVGLDAHQAWEILADNTCASDWAGLEVPALLPHARALNLSLHLAQYGLEDRKAARDLELGLLRLDDETWQAAAELARQLSALDAFTAGLNLFPQGIELAGRLGLRPPRDVGAVMRASTASYPATALNRVFSAPTWRHKVRVVRTQLFPSRQWLREYDPDWRDTRWGALRARLRRPVRIILQVPSALRERRRYRSRTAGGNL